MFETKAKERYMLTSQPDLRTQRRFISLSGFSVFALLVIVLSFARPSTAQTSKVMGEVLFNPATKVEARSGVWVDGQYVGFMSELKGDKKILLLPGSHEISIRQVGYADLTHVIVVEPGTVNPFYIKLAPNNAAQYPGKDAAELKLNIKPKRAAVFLDDGYAGDAGHFGGANTMLVSPGSHHIKVELPGYRTFETDITLMPKQTSKVSAKLVVGSIQEAGALIKEPVTKEQ
jgi:hypothetical protein